MSNEALFRVLSVCLLAVLLGVRGFFGRRSRRHGHSSWQVSEEAARREGGWSLALRAVLLVALMAMVVVYAAFPRQTAWLLVALPGWARWSGVGLASIGLAALVWVHAALGRHWSTTLQLRAEHTLVTTGPYRWVRHPMYTALALCFLGTSLASAAWPFLLLSFGAVFLFLRVVRIEEAMLTDHFGEVYRAYRLRTGRFLPRLRCGRGTTD
jgi:protein-S-isoprenylcysteine O-methyltransferase Ste14